MIALLLFLYINRNIFKRKSDINMVAECTTPNSHTPKKHGKTSNNCPTLMTLENSHRSIKTKYTVNSEKGNLKTL